MKIRYMLMLVPLVAAMQSCDRRSVSQLAWDDKTLMNPSKMKELLDRGLDPNLESGGQGEKDFLLLRATRYRQVETVKVLLEHGADPSKVSWGFKKTPLFFAAGDGDLGIMKLLLDAGADVNATDQNRNNALREAAVNKRLAAVELLMEKGIDPLQTNANGESMLDIARNHSTPEIVSLLTSRKPAESPPNEMSFPTRQALDCPPFGERIVTFDMEPEVSGDHAAAACRQVIAGWHPVWEATRAGIEGLLKDYEYGETLDGLLERPENTLNVCIVPPEDDEAFRFHVFLDVAFEHGSQVFDVEFKEIEVLEATATF